MFDMRWQTYAKIILKSYYISHKINRRRLESKAKAREMMDNGDIHGALETFKKSLTVTNDMARAVHKMCREKGVQCIIAPYEADAQLAYLYKRKYITTVITEDSDLIPFGVNRILTKMADNGDGYEFCGSRLVGNRGKGTIASAALQTGNRKIFEDRVARMDLGASTGALCDEWHFGDQNAHGVATGILHPITLERYTKEACSITIADEEDVHDREKVPKSVDVAAKELHNPLTITVENVLDRENVPDSVNVPSVESQKRFIDCDLLPSRKRPASAFTTTKRLSLDLT
ncbi:hypothetical protein SARC_04238 [Sphaeroforma arctica JP610]|uniref:XPG-I domain-containing protein n=1 Tax=Sphaeroforma arctica JP610 TaxID=667725 RepID=A0A0L0G2Z9_9EUKA|nr:hypothetical protein SARC_04238 [Sphaeroforma arctica JP610]KNC83507.1 hypothetical protein SARC_04238 [Sphaeroforma arctica JP610]|eukprot:XP_014157409.1 hypothetical protein SARC_04238 [Sphaeroforma arctica JP610]